MANLEIVSDKFKPITEQAYKKYKSFDSKSNRPVTFTDGRILLNQIGFNLSSIKIDQNDLNTNSHDFLELVLILCPNLEHLRIDDITLDSKMLKKMKNLFPKLKSIELISCGLTDYIEQYLETAKFLEKLNLRKNEKLKGAFISKFKNLVSLNLSRCENIPSVYFSNESFSINHTNLVQLNIIRCQLTPTSVINIGKYLLNLEELSISSFYVYLTSNDFLPLANLPKLKKLKIKFHRAGNIDDLLVKLGEKDLLQHLNISDVPLTKKSIEAIVIFTKLEILKIYSNYGPTDFNDKILWQLRCKETIKELSLVRCSSLTAAGLISFVEKSPNIHVLDLNSCYFITNEFYFSILASLKELNRQQCLTLIINNVRMKEYEIGREMIANNRQWLQLKFLKDDELPIDDDADSVESYQPTSSPEGKFFFLPKVNLG